VLLCTSLGLLPVRPIPLNSVTEAAEMTSPVLISLSPAGLSLLYPTQYLCELVDKRNIKPPPSVATSTVMEGLSQRGESVASLVAPAAAPLLAPAAGDPMQPTATAAAGALNLLTAAGGASTAGQSMEAAAANSGTAAVGAGTSNLSTAAASATSAIAEVGTSRGKRVSVWDHFEDTKKPYRVGQPPPRVMCIYCAENEVTGGINGRVSIMVNHLKACPFTPASVKAAVVPLEEKRNHRVRAHVALAPGMAGAMHAHLFKPMSVARYEELEKDMLNVALS